KKRKPDQNGKSYDDFLCEEWSVFRNGSGEKIGWTLDPDKRTDFVAYAITGLQKCYLLPFELLRITAQKNIENWKALKWAYPKDATNNGYATRNCAVPWNVLFNDMRQQMHRKFGASMISLPQPQINGEQTTFCYYK